VTEVDNVGGADATADDEGNRVEGATARAVVSYLVGSIAADADAVTIDTDARGRSVRFQVHVAPEDMGRVIGRRGRVAQAIRTVVAAAGARDGVQTSVDIVDE
jgi:predicted RNA-binding protein YlqC (UPF0109 family)